MMQPATFLAKRLNIAPTAAQAALAELAEAGLIKLTYRLTSHEKAELVRNLWNYAVPTKCPKPDFQEFSDTLTQRGRLDSFSPNCLKLLVIYCSEISATNFCGFLGKILFASRNDAGVDVRMTDFAEQLLAEKELKAKAQIEKALPAPVAAPDRDWAALGEKYYSSLSVTDQNKIQNSWKSTLTTSTARQLFEKKGIAFNLPVFFSFVGKNFCYEEK